MRLLPRLSPLRLETIHAGVLNLRHESSLR